MRPGPMNIPLEASRAQNDVELSYLDLRYDSCRMKAAAFEERLLGSVAERGIEEPLEGVEVGGKKILLNGFKRYRCARKLRLGAVPFVSMGEDAATGIVRLLKHSNAQGLKILEQAAFIDELKSACNMTVAQIAEALSRSKAWVSLRLGLFSQMSAAVRQKLFAGDFPARSYLYTLRPFTRVNGGAKAVEEFVTAVSGKDLSGREIERLAQGFFHGGEALRAEIAGGNLALPLERMKLESAHGADGCSEFERGMLRDLEVAGKAMLRVRAKSDDARLSSGPFRAQAHLLTEGILSRASEFVAAVRRLHDRGRPA